MLKVNKSALLEPAHTLPGRTVPIEPGGVHAVKGSNMQPPYPDGLLTIQLGLGCFWGAERLFWQLEGVWTTAAGYAGGETLNPSYQEVCSGLTNHAEVVLVVYDPDIVSTEALLQVFWEAHDPTQGMRQGNDRGTQYRSVIYVNTEQELARAEASRAQYQQALNSAGLGAITTEIRQGQTFFFAEEYHQQYLHKNPAGYCGLRGTGVRCQQS